jgi:signaling intermediate in Toll pathway protein
MPDEEMGSLVLNVFGKYSEPYKRYCRMMYWMPKFKNLSPWPLPDELPSDALELAKMAVRQITSVDPSTKVEVQDTADILESNDKTWVVSGQSPEQQQLLEGLAKGTALYVEGAFRVWLRSSQVSYFILRGPPVPKPPPSEMDTDSVRRIG